MIVTPVVALIVATVVWRVVMGGLRMPVKTFTGSTLFGPVPDRNGRDYALIAIIKTELLY